MVDIAALTTALDTEPRYNAAVMGGRNRELLALLNADEAGETIFLEVSSEDLLEAIGDGVRGLSATQLETLRLYTSRETVDMRKPALRAELLQMFGGNANARTRISDAVSRTKTYGEAFGGEVTLGDLWAALRGVTKSYMAQQIARG